MLPHGGLYSGPVGSRRQARDARRPARAALDINPRSFVTLPIGCWALNWRSKRSQVLGRSVCQKWQENGVLKFGRYNGWGDFFIASDLFRDSIPKSCQPDPKLGPSARANAQKSRNHFPEWYGFGVVGTFWGESFGILHFRKKIHQIWGVAGRPAGGKPDVLGRRAHLAPHS